MEYKGKLYGKIGNKYFDTGHTTDDYDDLINRIEELDKIVGQNLPLDCVSNQRELLIAFAKWANIDSKGFLPYLMK